MATKTNSRDRRLQELGGSDYEIADGEPDIRGWDVKDASGQRIGEVDDLIFDTEALKVRYMKVDLEGKVLDTESRDVLIPIGLAQLDDDDDDVILNNVTVEQLRALPEYDEDKLDTEYEYGIQRVFGNAGTTAAATGVTGTGLASDTNIPRDRDTAFYNNEYYNDENLYRNRRRENVENAEGKTSETIPVVREQLNIDKREVERGGIRLRSRIVETPVEERVNLRKENVNVERIPTDRPATEADFREDEMEIREREEVPVVNKEARVVEEIRVNKDVTERDETIRDTVRDTEVDIDKLDKKKRRNKDTDTDSTRY